MNRAVLTIIALAVLLCGCKEEDPAASADNKDWLEYNVAVILPMNDDLGTRWQRTLNMFSENFNSAFRNQPQGVKLKFEYFDENSSDLRSIASELGAREDVAAVIGGLYSVSARVIAESVCRYEKPFFTLATCEELVRAFSSTGQLWAMTETDITQCEVLLSKVINYGGKSVALLAKEDDAYGQTFIDWFSFQANELGLENKGVFTYNTSNIAEASSAAARSDAEFVICIPSEVEEISPMLTAFEKVRASSGKNPRTLFSDTAYGSDVIKTLGEKAEGLEGVTFGADPESGFEVSYKEWFGTSTTLGEPQLYDAAMLIGYALWYQTLHPEESLRTALRTVVSGEGRNMGSWMAEDLRLVVDGLAAGDTPDIRGASGPLEFDSKVYTNVLNTTYYNYIVYGGNYLILDYNTSDGGNRTDATLAGWNWKASHMQDFNNGTSISYPEHTGNKALLVATSSGWSNYRHQTDVLSIYRLLKSSGYSDDDIILIMEDDIAMNPANPRPGTVTGKPGGENLYRDVKVDYKMSALSAEDFYSILKGEKSAQLPVVFDSTGEGDNIFIFWSGHVEPGAMCWADDTHAVAGDGLRTALTQMVRNRSYRKLLMMVEACYSGGVMEQCAGLPGMMFITAADKNETSKADIFSEELNVWMSNRFTSTFIEQINANQAISMRDMYYRLFINTVGSHVMVYNANLFDNLYSSDMSEFIMYKHK